TAYHYKQMTNEWYQPLADESHPEPTLKANAQTPPASTMLPNQELFTKPKPLKPFLILLIGVDSREGERARSDTMILAAIHPSNQHAYLLSIPRDSLMEVPGRGYDKVNHAMAFGGPKLLKKSL
ncbi:LCP family protein, partial [Microbacteriaceae bacterium K1510]|nr:LCP family protein [Microbacteriaceae bacterium K1510]